MVLELILKKQLSLEALKKAHAEYDIYTERHLTHVERDYLAVLNKTVLELNKWFTPKSGSKMLQIVEMEY